MQKSKIAPPATLKARAYVRVSHVGARADTLLSDAMQLDEAKRYAEYIGFQFDETASRQDADLDVSGFRKPWRQRPGLMRHYEAARRGEFNVLIFYKISRLARNVREALDMIEEFEKLGVAFHFVAEKIDSTSAQGRFVRNVLLSSAEMQSEDTSSFIKSAALRRARDGKLHGGALPAWLRYREDRTIEPVPEQVVAVHRMIELRLVGTGYVKIARQLNVEGFRTGKRKYWTDGGVYKYLSEHYIRSMTGTGFFGRWRPDAIEIHNAYPAIISEAEADRLIAIQKLYSEQFGRKIQDGLDWSVSARRKNGRYSASSIHLLSSLVFCPFCGSRMVAASKSDNNRSTPYAYRCPRYLTRPDEHRRLFSSINAYSLEDAVLRVLRFLLATPPDPIDLKTRGSKPAVADLAELQSRVERLVTMHLDGKLDEADFTRLYATLTEERERKQSETLKPVEPEFIEQARMLSEKPDVSRSELRQLILLLIEKVEAPVEVEGVKIRPQSQSLRKLARITLRFPTASGDRVFLSSICQMRFEGERTFAPESSENLQEVLTGVRRR